MSEEQEYVQEDLKKMKVLLEALLDDTNLRMAKAERSRQTLQQDIERFRADFFNKMGTMNAFRQEELHVKLRSVEREALEFDRELEALRIAYDRLERDYRKLCK